MKFQLDALNDYEFELLCKDILSRQLNIHLYTFPKGRDGGIDISDSLSNPRIVGQAKHYCKSSYQLLISSLKKEKDRILNEIKPEKYFVCASQSLTRENRKEIYDMFQECMEDISNVIDATEIDAFLSKEENADIVRKHYKLWLSASNVLTLVNNQNIFIDCEELVEEIESQAQFFVQTRAYQEALKKMEENRAIIIIGNPGVGKTTLSKMLIFKYVSEDYIVRYSTDSKVGNIKKALSMNPEKKEIILLDDFLGQHYLKIRESQPSEIKSLMSYVKRNPNKKLILNSRITILNEAIQSSLVFREWMENSESYTYLINLDKMGIVEKAKILYNHLYFNYVPAEYFSEIRKEKRYYRLVQHKNYNPRIIEYVTKPRVYKSIAAEKYFSYIMKKLDEPTDVWRDEYRNRMNEEDRVLLNTMYSLTDTTISREILEMAYNKRIGAEVFPTSMNVYQESCARLTDSLLKNVVDRDMIRIGAINPSVNDYLKSHLSTNSTEQIKIIENAAYMEQIFKTAITSEALDACRRMMLDGTFLKRKALKNSVEYYYLKMLCQCEIFEEAIKPEVRYCFAQMGNQINLSEQAEYGNLLYILIDSGYMEYYELGNILKQKSIFEKILGSLLYGPLIEVLKLLKKKGFFTETIMKQLGPIVREELREKIYARAHFNVESDSMDILSDLVDDCNEEMVSLTEEQLIIVCQEEAHARMQEELEKEIDRLLREVEAVMNMEVEDFSDLIEEADFPVYETLKALISQEQILDEDMAYESWRDDGGRDEWDEVRDIFER